MTPALFQQLLIPRSVYEGMLWHARAETPLECCGLLAGRIVETSVGEVRLRYPLVNAAASAIEYASDPASLFFACKDARRQGLEVLAFYHSHPTSQPIPSRTDLERNYWGDSVVHLIVSLARPTPTVRGWWLQAEGYREVTWRIEG